MPILVRQASVSQKIYDSDLALELDMPNPRNLNYVLGEIGNSLLELSKTWNEKVPPIQCIVIKKNTELPGEGINWFGVGKTEYLFPSADTIDVLFENSKSGVGIEVKSKISNEA